MKIQIASILMLLSVGMFCRAQEMVMVNKAIPPENNMKSSREAPRFEFMAFSQVDDMKQLNNTLVSPHFLGDEIARKMVLLNKAYTYEAPVAPGTSATKTIYTKSVIYNSVKRIERDLKKKLKSGAVAESLAVSEFTRVLDVALNVVNQNTTGLEERLSSMNDSAAMLEVYLQEVKLNWVN